MPLFLVFLCLMRMISFLSSTRFLHLRNLPQSNFQSTHQTKREESHFLIIFPFRTHILWIRWRYWILLNYQTVSLLLIQVYFKRAEITEWIILLTLLLSRNIPRHIISSWLIRLMEWARHPFFVILLLYHEIQLLDYQLPVLIADGVR